MHHPHKPIVHSKKKNSKVNESPHQCFFKAGGADINKNQKYSNFLHTYFDSDHALDLYEKCSVTSEYHLFNDTVI